jgi:hypothetical protein
VIISLIVGGVLVGRDLIAAAALRAQLTQIEKFNTAVHTFQVKYGYLPGDILDPMASSIGLQARGTYRGEGDGNGILESNCGNVAGGYSRVNAGCGEIAVFWQDLSTTKLIANLIGVGACLPNTAGGVCIPSLTTTPGIQNWIPTAQIAPSLFVYVYSASGTNYFALSTVTQIGWDIQSSTNPGLTSQQAYIMDAKVDDGLPQSGHITAQYLNYDIVSDAPIWAAGGGVVGAALGTLFCRHVTAMNYSFG